jgi:hypothetical protein
MRGRRGGDAGVGIVHDVRRGVESAAERDGGADLRRGFLGVGSVCCVLLLAADES